MAAELDLWDTPPTFWWRDDDAQAVTPALERLVDQSVRYGAPLHLAVIPEGQAPQLGPWLQQHDHVWVLQHGLRHANHEPKGLRPSEVGVSRALAAQEADLRAGWRLLDGLPRRLPVFVPPWNRIGPATEQALPGWGFPALSGDGPAATLDAIAGLARVNVHFDPIQWKGGAHFRGVARTLKSTVAHLQARRLHGWDEPTGMVTHHLDSDEETWAFQEELLRRLDGRAAWVSLAGRVG